MTDTQALENALRAINDARNIALVPSQKAGADSFSAAVGMYFALEEFQKEVHFVFPHDIPQPATDLIEDYKIITDVREKELLVSIDYTKTKAGHAHYLADDGELHIKLGPIHDNFSAEDHIKTRLVGYEFDAIVVLGAQSLEDLGETFEHLSDVFETAHTINVDNSKENSGHGKTNLISHESPSLSKQALDLVTKWELPLGERAARAFLTGMTYKNGENDPKLTIEEVLNLPLLRLENPQNS